MKPGRSRRLRKAELPGSNPGRSIIVKTNKKEIYIKSNSKLYHHLTGLYKAVLPWDSPLDDPIIRIQVSDGPPISR